MKFFSSFNIKKQYFVYPILALLIATGCKSTVNDEKQHQKYSIYILGKNHKEYLIQTNDFSKGELKPEEDGVALDTKIFDRDIIVKDGYYYHLNQKSSSFSKYIKTARKLKEIAALKLEGFSIENFYWLAADTLLLTGLDSKTFANPMFYEIATENLMILRSGKLPIAKPFGKFESTSLGITKFINNKLFIAYTYHHYQNPSTYTTSDTINMVSLNYPEMTLSAIEKDTRSAYPGGVNTIQSYDFITENGDFYFMSCPGIALGNIPDKPTGIFRITKDKTTIDKDYFFNISASKINNHAYGVWYLGNNKAIIRSERKDLYKDFDDHASTAHFEFYVLDLITQSVQKLNLPLDKGTRRESVVVDGGTAFISINSDTEGNYIWLYDLKSGILKKGLKLSGDTNYIYRIDKN